eukprot:6175382-Pleurochrysis_carterae.AAC.1
MSSVHVLTHWDKHCCLLSWEEPNVTKKLEGSTQQVTEIMSAFHQHANTSCAYACHGAVEHNCLAFIFEKLPASYLQANVSSPALAYWRGRLPHPCVLSEWNPMTFGNGSQFNGFRSRRVAQCPL